MDILPLRFSVFYALPKFILEWILPHWIEGFYRFLNNSISEYEHTLLKTDISSTEFY